MTTKLDVYDYLVLPEAIRITISGQSDPIIVDILSEIENFNGRIYVEGKSYQYVDYGIFTDTPDGSYLELNVIELN